LLASDRTAAGNEPSFVFSGPVGMLVSATQDERLDAEKAKHENPKGNRETGRLGNPQFRSGFLGKLAVGKVSHMFLIAERRV